ncbi:glycogen debranching protein GlgX [Sulfuriroseicoccus oceanibius]|uniref:Glycogen debranching protein GlgX n=1 Tax=Sulfuriroseicoccus oceanibius TaxID=2707525 RepID=A0A7T7JDD3_9BACT|nr:glycogen debranching protein GlgX [Sulfuriroseicoccus oceanibius]QQL45941.1 glycogen debranching protein GlgX [Sulfuriroseicoccus oceanibius]
MAGKPFPIGATPCEDGVNFAIFSENSTAMDVCLFDPENPKREIARVRCPRRTQGVWHVFVPGLKPGALYAFRAHGRYEPEHGFRFNPHKLLVDPYAKLITGTLKGRPELSGSRADDSIETTDTARFMPRCMVIDNDFNWEGDEAPQIPYNDTIIYEAHVKGFTKLHPQIPDHLRGTYAGLASDEARAHLRELGVTTVQLMPVHYHLDDEFLVSRGLTNYWGYQTLGYFAPHLEYAADQTGDGAIREFKGMVKALHRDGIEVILDVVYNHTCEGNHLGPTLSFRGLDNHCYYRLERGHPEFYSDMTGTGNTVDLRHPKVLQMVLDSLRYWVTEMHVDGFRFDLAATLGRESDGFARNGAFFRAIQQDPVLSKVKLIAEPWDTGYGGYQVGNFPEPFSELNGKYRDHVRSFWKGDAGSLPNLASRLTGSEDVYGSFVQPLHSINFVTCHDGFTLRDLVSYNDKHNLANNEGNRDGEGHNISWNHGEEGPTQDEEIRKLRRRQSRNFLATLFLSQGVPFLLAGDEFGRTQKGNNNAYCQDNEISWLNWELDEDGRDLLNFTRKIIELRKNHHIFSKSRFLHGNSLRGTSARDVIWLRPEGTAMNAHDWHDGSLRSMGMLLSGTAHSQKRDWRISRQDKCFLVLAHAGSEFQSFRLPGSRGVRWETIVHTADHHGFVDSSKNPELNSGDPFSMPPYSLAVFKLTAGSEHEAQSPPSDADDTSSSPKH